MKHLLILTLVFIFTSNAYAAIESLDKIIAVVNEDVITIHELNSRTNEYKKKLKLYNLSEEDENSLTKQVLEKMIRTQIQLQHAEKLGIKVDDVALNRILEKIASDNKLTMKKLEKIIKAEGLEFNSFREQTRQDVIMKQLQERMVTSKINVTEQEIEQFIKQNSDSKQSDTKYLLSHILIATPETAKPEDIQAASSKANRLYNEILQGGDFSDIALRYSNGRNALKGGDLGWRKSNELPVVFLKAIEDLQDGEVSMPVRSAGGFHILKIRESSRQKDMLQQTHARHILIRTGASMSTKQARTTLLSIKKQLADGKDFAELAEQYSQDPGSKDNGGDLGWANPGMFVPSFEKAMNELEPGEISEPFSSQFGWHIIQVIERRLKDRTNDVLNAQAREAIHKRKAEEELQLWIRRIHNESYIVNKLVTSDTE